MLGENAVPVYRLDRDALVTVAARIGPTVDELATPLAPDEFPELRSFVFREHGIGA